MVQNNILKYLRSSDDYLSGEEISRKLNISRAGIWKNIQELRKKGYAIDAVTHKGYMLRAAPDKLLPQEVQSHLNTQCVGQNMFHHETITSTMDEAFKLGLDNAADGTVVCAEGQSQGRGRLGRQWQSPKGKGIYASLILRPNIVATDAAKLTLMAGVAIYEAIKKVCDVDLSIKWPNDLLIDGKKVCGVLTEMNAQMECVNFVVIGFGINVNTSTRQILPQGTSLKIETGTFVSRLELFQEVLRSFDRWYVCVKEKGFVSVLEQWREYTSTLGRQVRIQDVEGEAIDIDEFGGLMIRTKQGVVVRRMSGDVLEIGS